MVFTRCQKYTRSPCLFGDVVQLMNSLSLPDIISSHDLEPVLGLRLRRAIGLHGVLGSGGWGRLGERRAGFAACVLVFLSILLLGLLARDLVPLVLPEELLSPLVLLIGNHLVRPASLL